jgi:hypothetical protein
VTTDHAAADTTDVADTASTDTAVDETTTTEAELAPFAAVAPGPHDVGVQTITITDTARGRPLTVDAWFPIDDATGLPAHQYTLLPGVYYESPTAIDADPSTIAAGGPFPPTTPATRRSSGWPAPRTTWTSSP